MHSRGYSELDFDLAKLYQRQLYGGGADGFTLGF